MPSASEERTMQMQSSLAQTNMTKQDLSSNKGGPSRPKRGVPEGNFTYIHLTVKRPTKENDYLKRE